MDQKIKLANQIIKLREQSGLTQESVANKLGLSRQRYIAIEKADRDLNIEELEILSTLFGISIIDFFNEPRNNQKFVQMYFYILKQIGKVQKTKLAKLLYLADFRNFYEELEPMERSQIYTA